MRLVFLLIGVGIGLLLAAAIVGLALKRSYARALEAERRALGAERLAEIGALTGGLAHEIKNPLSTIGLNAQLASEAAADLPVDSAEKDALLRRIETLRREIERLRDILDTFLRFAGEMHLDLSATDLNEVVEELADFYLPQAQQAGVRLRVDLAPGPLPAMVDRSQLKQALLNLMINATQAMQGGDPGETQTRELILRTEDGGSAMTNGPSAHVIDTGPGIEEDRLLRIFDPYFTTRSGGTGLGLPITRRIVEEHGGMIEAHSEVGRGTDFAITLPRPS